MSVKTGRFSISRAILLSIAGAHIENLKEIKKGKTSYCVTLVKPQKGAHLAGQLGMFFLHPKDKLCQKKLCILFIFGAYKTLTCMFI